MTDIDARPKIGWFGDALPHAFDQLEGVVTRVYGELDNLARQRKERDLFSELAEGLHHTKTLLEWIAQLTAEDVENASDLELDLTYESVERWRRATADAPWTDYTAGELEDWAKAVEADADLPPFSFKELLQRVAIAAAMFDPAWAGNGIDLAEGFDNHVDLDKWAGSHPHLRQALRDLDVVVDRCVGLFGTWEDHNRTESAPTD